MRTCYSHSAFVFPLIAFMVTGTALAALSPSGSARGMSIDEAARAGDIKAVAALLSETPSLVNYRNDLGETPLHVAAAAPNAKALTDLLLRSGADVKARSNSGATPLFRAAGAGNDEVVRLLLDHGADINARDSRGWTALHQALYFSKMQTAALLLARGAEADIFDLAALGDIRRVAMLLRQDPTLVVARDGEGYTAVQWAAARKQRTTLEVFLAYRPSLDVFSASAAGDDAQVQQLLNQDPNLVRATDAHGLTALCWAVIGGNLEVARHLLSRGADPNVGRPLFTAAREGDRPMAELLLQFHADKSLFVPGFGTASTVALAHGHPEVASLLK